MIPLATGFRRSLPYIFAGLLPLPQNSNFAYFGYDFSQEIPFPGKLRLRASLAEKEAESAHEEYQAEQCAIIEQVSESYFNL